ncbi:MAG TPA: 2Fe-2S iron-sulfur cluster-binding protein [Candidatus Dormibacteraeota bacterium]|nr:2Fe-2S iron-sulfur cluster-binding protein [Candidatus Dormibacteraeota bacterium]
MTQAGEAPPPPDDGRVEVTIDGRVIRAPKGQLVLDAATDVGVHIPIYCAHPKMDPVAVCRMCLVQIEKFPKLQPACATYVSEGMVVHTQTEPVTKAREGVLEFLLLNHPLDCPVCDRGGECDLQDFAFRYGPQTSRMPITDKVHFEKAVPLSDRIELDNERCILCWRCVRYYDEITGEKEIVLQQRGVQTEVATFDGRPLRSAFQGNLPEVCPVGALTHRQYRFVARPWDLQRARSVCPECSYGCNINIDSREYEVKRFASRDNPLVDDMWLCDRGRYSVPRWNRTDRVRRPVVRPRAGEDQEVSVQQAVQEAGRRLRAIRDQHGANAIGVLGSTECTNQEAWLLQRLAREALGTSHLDHQLEPFPGLAPEEHALGIAEIEDCSAVVVLGTRPEQQAPVLTLRLYKAQRKRGTVVHRLPVEVDDATVRAITGQRLLGVIADEVDRAEAAHVAQLLARGNTEVRRFTVSRGVNGRGCKDLGLLPNLLPGYRPAPGAGRCGTEILEATSAGQIRALVVMGSQPWAATAGVALTGALNAADLVVAIETQPGPVSQGATVLIPGHTHVEKGGSVTNLEGRVQRIRAALPPATTVPTELRVLAMLAAELGCERWPAEVIAVDREIGVTLPAYAEAGDGGRVRWPVAVS